MGRGMSEAHSISEEGGGAAGAVWTVAVTAGPSGPEWMCAHKAWHSVSQSAPGLCAGSCR